MKLLYLIPARGGSKGIPRKNIKELSGKPLITYSIDVARQLTDDCNICISTDDEEIMQVVTSYGLTVPFKRPDFLATDSVGTYEVILHAIGFYENLGVNYDAVVLLQPTSPLRTAQQVMEAIGLYDKSVDAVVSVCESPQNPYYNLFEENGDGYLHVSKGNGTFRRRQDTPSVWMFNGAIYVFNVESLRKGYFDSFKKIRKYVMPLDMSIDLDTLTDWMYLEAVMNKRK